MSSIVNLLSSHGEDKRRKRVKDSESNPLLLLFTAQFEKPRTPNSQEDESPSLHGEQSEPQTTNRENEHNELERKPSFQTSLTFTFGNKLHSQPQANFSQIVTNSQT